METVEAIRAVRLFTKNCRQVSSLLRCAWFFYSLVRLCFPSIPVEQVNCLCSLEEILHFCGYLKISWIREKMVFYQIGGPYSGDSSDYHRIFISESGIWPFFDSKYLRAKHCARGLDLHCCKTAVPCSLWSVEALSAL